MLNLHKIWLLSCLCVIVMIILYFQTEITRLEQNYQKLGMLNVLYCNKLKNYQSIRRFFRFRIQVNTKSFKFSSVFPENYRKG